MSGRFFEMKFVFFSLEITTPKVSFKGKYYSWKRKAVMNITDKPRDRINIHTKTAKSAKKFSSNRKTANLWTTPHVCWDLSPYVLIKWCTLYWTWKVDFFTYTISCENFRTSNLKKLPELVQPRWKMSRLKINKSCILVHFGIKIFFNHGRNIYIQMTTW